MGRYDFRPQRVLQTANQLLETGRLKAPPPWYNTISQVPPGEILTRPVKRHEQVTANRGKGSSKRPSKMFQPLKIVYPEDKLRSQFFNDHPWELARPRQVLEDTGNDAKNWNWSQIEQPGKALDGESVVQRQQYLIKNFQPEDGEVVDQQTIEERAYDQARKEFYELRLRQDVERQVSREEGLHVGVEFKESEIEKAHGFEDWNFTGWKMWAQNDMEREKHQQAANMGLATVEEESSEDGPVGQSSEAPAS